MELLNLLSDIIASLTLRPALFLEINSKIFALFFLIPVLSILINFFPYKKNPEDAQFQLLDRIHVLNFLPQILSTGTNLFILAVCGIIGVRGLMLPPVQGETTYLDPYGNYTIQMPRNWIITYNKPFSNILDAYITTGNSSMQSKEGKDYIFIGLLNKNAGGPIVTNNKKTFGSKVVDIIYHNKISAFEDEIAGTIQIKGKNLLIAGTADSEILRYFISTIK